jgi:hypothetical protein
MERTEVPDLLKRCSSLSFGINKDAPCGDPNYLDNSFVEKNNLKASRRGGGAREF